MTSVVVYGFPISTFVNIVRVVLTEKGVPFEFRDLEKEMGKPTHLKLHPFNRVPILDHDGFVLYETSAIVAYIDQVFDGPSLQPADARQRARMNQWISAVNNYYYPYMSYHLSHERMIFPALNIKSDEKVVAAALPKIAVALDVLDRQLGEGHRYLICDSLTLADFYILPTLTSITFTPEGQQMLADNRRVRIRDWMARMSEVPSVVAVRLLARHRDQYRVLVLKVVIERTDADAGEFGNRIGVESRWTFSLQNSSSGFKNDTYRLSRPLLGRRFSHVFKVLLHLLHLRTALAEFE